MRGEDAADEQFCARSLEAVSRTFAVPIAMLGAPLRGAVGASYLLCRVVDTVEDDPHLTTPARDALFAAFLAALEGGSAAPFQALVRDVHGTVDELALASDLPRVLRVLGRAPDEMVLAARRWIGEMARGMAIYGARPPGPDGVRALVDLADLRRYCYFVAGTVGHLLTDLFVLAHGDALRGRRERVLREHAEAFGIGLQLVNVLKDIADDRRRGVSFVPRRLGGDAASFALADPAQRKAAHAAIAPVFRVADACLDEALAYTLAVPPSLGAERRFLAVPLLLAVATLRAAEGSDALFDPAARVAIPRAEALRIIELAADHASEDDRIVSAFASLRRDGALHDEDVRSGTRAAPMGA